MLQGAEVHHRSLKPMKTLRCIQCKRTWSPVPGRRAQLDWSTRKVRLCFLFPKSVFQAVKSATVHVKHVQPALVNSCQSSVHVRRHHRSLPAQGIIFPRGGDFKGVLKSRANFCFPMHENHE